VHNCTVFYDRGGRVYAPLFYISNSYISIASIDFGSIVEGVAQRRPPFFYIKATLRTLVAMTLLIAFILLLGAMGVSY